MSGIIWLASYPKSGNTWMRVFLAHLMREEETEFHLNALGGALHDGLGIASDRGSFDEIAGLAASELLPDEIDRLRPRVYETAAARAGKPIFVKVHDALLPNQAGERLIPAAATRGVLYIVRNPLDVAVSFAFHTAVDFDTAIARMGDADFALSNGTARLPQQLRQRLSSWSGHVASWIDAPDLACHVVRFEDMSAAPGETFAAAVRFLTLGHDDARIQQAIERARFDRLRAEEERVGFVEKPARMARFFRAGRSGGWRDHLSPAQAGRLVADHCDMMRRLGYLDAEGEPRY